MKHKWGIFIGLLCWLSIGFSAVFAQDIPSLQCGDIFEGEVIKAEKNLLGFWRGERYGDFFMLDIQAGTHINVTVSPLGQTFNSAFVLLDSGGSPVLVVNDSVAGGNDGLTDFELGSSRQLIVIMGIKPDYPNNENPPGWSFGSSDWVAAGQYFGAYEIRLGCTLRDGTVIEPGETASAENSGGGTGNPPAPPTTCTGICFAGLPPKDLNNMAKLPLVAGAPMSAALTPTGSEIYGFGLDAVSGQTLNLNITRIAGNLNVAVVLLTPDNQTAFATILTSNTTLSTDLILPQDGQYIVAVFRADGFLPPTTPEASAFTITGTLQ